jgi:CubicO group peptidase (beta-lactamase class C family)
MPILRIACLALLLSFAPTALADETDYEKSIEAFLQSNFDQRNCGMVVALVDAKGTKIFAAGKCDDGTDREVDADTLFEIGSVSKTFTALLALEMDQRGEIKLDDPVAKYLPATVKVPSRNGKEITLQHLAEQSSGLPHDGDNLHPKDPKKLFEDYSAEKLHEFVSGYTLKQDPGSQFVYSNAGMALVGEALSRRAGMPLDRLMTERICGPLHMDSSRMTLTPEVKSRLAQGHDQSGAPMPSYEFGIIDGAGGIKSSANDMIKYVSASLGLTPSPLTPLMEKSHVIRHTGGRVILVEPFDSRTAMPWYDQGVYQSAGMNLIGHAGGTGGFSAFVGFDLVQRRGVVILSNQTQQISPASLGWRILQHARLTGLDATKMQPQREIVGIGAALEIDKLKLLRVTAIVPNSPAAGAGFGKGVVVQKINDMTTYGKTIQECLAQIRGPAGKQVRLELADASGGKVYELTTRKFFVDQ